MTNKREDGTYEVGYGRPPAGYRFEKGHSGNPKGRPKKNPRDHECLGAHMGYLDEKVTLADGKKITVGDVLFRKALNKAAEKGDVKSIAALMEKRPRERSDKTDYRAEIRKKIEDISRRLRDGREREMDPDP